MYAGVADKLGAEMVPQCSGGERHCAVTSSFTRLYDLKHRVQKMFFDLLQQSQSLRSAFWSSRWYTPRDLPFSVNLFVEHTR